MVKSQQSPQTDWLVAAVQRMLKPIVKLLVGRMACPVAVDLLKEAYIEEATRQLIDVEGRKRATKSALALKTGLDTRVIAALEAKPRSETVTVADMTPEASVLHAWSTDKAFVDPKSGQPRVLHIYGRRGTFQNLIMRYAGRNVTCPTVLASLSAGGNIEMLNDDQVRMLSPHFDSTSQQQKSAIETGSLALEHVGRNAVHNFSDEVDDKSSWPQQTRLGRNLSPAGLAELRKTLDRLLSSQADAVETALQSVAKTQAEDDEGRSAGVCAFYWEEPDQPR